MLHPTFNSRLTRRLGKTCVAIATMLAIGSLPGASQAHATRDSSASIKAKKASIGFENLALGGARDLVKIHGDLKGQVGSDQLTFEPGKSKGGEKSVKSSGKGHKAPKQLDRRSLTGYESRWHSRPRPGASPIPEPASALLIALGGLIVGGAVRRYR